MAASIQKANDSWDIYFPGKVLYLWRWILDLFVPPRCVVCEKVDVWLCEACAQQIPLFTVPMCSRCGRPWKGHGLCKVCQEAPLTVNPVRSVFLFEGAIRDVMHALKYRGAPTVIDPLLPHMKAAWSRYALQSDLLVPVPLHPKREARRGYNQAAVVARALGRSVRVPVDERALARARNTPSQTRLNRQERRANVDQAFVCAPEAAVSGKRVTLVDDVATTGATLDACATTLLAGGARCVSAFTLARAP